MGFLDNETIYQKHDPGGMRRFISDFPNQITSAWQEMKNVVIPTHYLNAKNIVILGMGGSSIAAELVKAYSNSKIKIPLEVFRDYLLPKYVDANSLVIAVSYSGNTEETLAAFTAASCRGAKLAAISSGGQIESLTHKFKCPYFKINYDSPPRAATGYSLMPLLYILAKLKFIELKDEEIEQIVSDLKEFQKKIDINLPTRQNEAKQLAEKLKGCLVISSGSGILAPVSLRFKTQLNENSKSFAAHEAMPEICHNFLQGLDLPQKIRDKVLVVLLKSRFDHPRNVLRFQGVQDIFRKKGIKYQIIELESRGSELAEILYYLHFVDYLSLYLAMLEGVDPNPYEMIIYLKKFLEENI